MKQCRNCETPFDGTFCPNCGQKDIDLERPIRELVGELLKETLDFDGRAWRTVRTLLVHPGVLTREYLAGRRQTYTPPLRLYLVISVSFFLLAAWIAAQGVLLEPGQTREADAASQAQFMSDELPKLMFVLLPLFSLLIKTVFPRRFYYDHLIFALHLHSAAYVILALMASMEQIAGPSLVQLVVQLVLLAYFLGYFVLSLRRVYGESWLVSSLKSVAVLFGYLVLVSVVIEATSSFQILAD